MHRVTTRGQKSYLTCNYNINRQNSHHGRLINKHFLFFRVFIVSNFLWRLCFALIYFITPLFHGLVTWVNQYLILGKYLKVPKHRTSQCIIRKWHHQCGTMIYFYIQSYFLNIFLYSLFFFFFFLMIIRYYFMSSEVPVHSNNI